MGSPSADRTSVRSCRDHATLKKHARRWGISVEHFDHRPAANRREPTPLAAVLVEGSAYDRGHLKRRLFVEGLKESRCELCGQGEMWRGARMALVLDHINGVYDDNRLENLRILCPNCNATLETHCGRKNRRPPRVCVHCGEAFAPRTRSQRFCSRRCSVHHHAAGLRVVSRPAPAELRAVVDADGFRAAARRYGVSDTTVRKWMRAQGPRLASVTRPPTRPSGQL